MTKAAGTADGDLRVVVPVVPGKGKAQSGVMLARVRPTGVFELLTGVAWARALGCLPEELNGTSLRDLMWLEKPAAMDMIAALLDEQLQAVEVSVRCKDERRKRFRLHRRFDAYEGSVFVMADELVDSPVEPHPAYD